MYMEYQCKADKSFLLGLNVNSKEIPFLILGRVVSCQVQYYTMTYGYAGKKVIGKKDNNLLLKNIIPENLIVNP